MESPTGLASFEVRWILPGPLDPALLGWFSRIPASTEAREDAYLLVPALDGLSVKIRGDRELDLKSRVQRMGDIELTPQARGRLESWQKSSFRFGADSERAVDSAMWRRVRKVRTMSWHDGEGWLPSRPPETSQRPKCAVELTDITTRDERWWTLGFEASGPEDERLEAIETAAREVFDVPVPNGLVLGPEDSGPYSEWLRRAATPGA
ncbi:MAG TPA: hypothetical protein VIC58_11565 [Actinomycetota bacterium]|jgi:hypothetical protein